MMTLINRQITRTMSLRIQSSLQKTAGLPITRDTIITARKTMRTLLILTTLIAAAAAGTIAHAETLRDLTVIAVYQLDDESNASFDFFTTEKKHTCGGKPSNRFRSYSRYESVAERKFQLVRDAFSQKGQLSVNTLSCEGDAMLVGHIGIRR